MERELEILIAEDDERHAQLIKKNLRRAGIVNRIFHFKNGQEVLNFLFIKGKGPHRERGKAYILLLDISMPQVDGLEVLTKIKVENELRKIPVIMLTTSDNPREIKHCHDIGCSSYIRKPIKYDNFVKTLRNLGLLLSIMEVPIIN